MSRRRSTLARLAAAMLFAQGCDDAPDAPDAATARAACDAGDEAWIKLTVQVLLGRRPDGIREVRVLQALLAQTDRATVARVIQEDPAWAQRWVDFFQDEVQVNRDGAKNFSECFGPVSVAAESPALARAIRDNGPETSVAGGATLADVLRSSLRLDDVTPFYRAWLFGMLARPSVYCVNLTALENDLARRQDFGQTFSATYLHRSPDCLPCHNSQFSVTAHPTPALNRFWAPPGNFEEALWGAPGGIEEIRGYALLRSLGVVASTYQRASDNYERPIPGGVTPWGLSAACGEFLPAAQVRPDTSMVEGHFAGPRGPSSSVWDTESLLRQGLTEISATHLPLRSGQRLSGAASFAYLLSQRIVHQVWSQVMGAPLTIGHGFSRNEPQRDALMALTTRFIADRFSLKRLLVAVVTHPLYNLRPPAEGCGSSAYPLAPVFDPWSIHATDTAARGNSAGDSLLREDARTLLRAASYAMGWPSAPAFPSEADSRFQHNVGAFVSERRTGFSGTNFQQMLAWEDRFGACLPPQPLVPPSNPVGREFTSCVGRCNVLEPPEEEERGKACACDPLCAVMDDCCDDFEAVCVTPAPPRAPDWIDALASAADTWQSEHPGEPLRLRDVVQALKDRLITAPDLDAEESSAVAALYGVPSLDAPLDAAGAWRDGTRRLCGVLLKSPQFMLRNVSLGDQSSAPRLVVGATSFRALCERWAAPVRAGAGRALRCEGERLTVQ